jgi:FKBP-type peptidyl-prolyl cis-trans isomerase FkpA
MLVLVALAALPVIFAGCTESPTGPSSSAPYSQIDLLVGSGAEAVAGSVVTVEYTAWLYDGSQDDLKGLQFDSSTGRGPLSFTLGASEVITGWDQGVVGMRVGGVRRLVVPPSLAYGPSRYGRIPPNVSLVFDIELLSVE